MDLLNNYKKLKPELIAINDKLNNITDLIADEIEEELIENKINFDDVSVEYSLFYKRLNIEITFNTTTVNLDGLKNIIESLGYPKVTTDTYSKLFKTAYYSKLKWFIK